MKTLRIMNACKHVNRLLKTNSPLVGLIIAGVGFTGSIVSTASATVKAVRNTDEEKADKGRELSNAEVVEANWKYYVAPVLLWAGSIASLCFAAKGYEKSIKSLTALYAASECVRKNFESSAKEKMTEKEYEEVQDEVADKVLKSNPVTSTTILETGFGPFLCYDTLSGRYFRCSTDHIKQAVNAFNNRICTQKCGLSYNELFDEISPKFDDIIFGKNVGWGPEKGVADIRYRSRLADNGEPCIVMMYNTEPYENYDWWG